MKKTYIIAMCVFLLGVQDGFAGDKSLQAETLKCNGVKLCDGAFQNDIILIHPNVDLVQKNTNQKLATEDSRARLLIGSKNAYWEMGNHWTLDSIISYSKEVPDPDYDGGSYRTVASVSTTAQNVTNGAGLFNRALKFIVDRDKVSSSLLSSVTNVLKMFGTTSHVAIFNPTATGKESFGAHISSYNTFVEFFPTKSGSEVESYLNSKSYSEEQKKSYINDNTYKLPLGQESALSENDVVKCEVDEQTYFSELYSKYCKWNNFGMGQRFKNPVSLKNGFRFSTTLRLLNATSYHITNKYLLESGVEEQIYYHLNARIILERKRNKILKFDDPRKTGDEETLSEKKTDTITLSVPLFEVNELCMNPDFAAKESSTCSMLDKDKTGYAADSKVHSKPDAGTGRFMFRVGRNDISLSVQTGGKTLEERIRKIASGEWFNISFEKLPNFETLFKNAITDCKNNHETWNYPAAWCDIESTNLSDYDVVGVNFGSEVRGAHYVTYQFEYFNFYAK